MDFPLKNGFSIKKWIFLKMWTFHFWMKNKMGDPPNHPLKCGMFRLRPPAHCSRTARKGLGCFQ